jgi:glycine/D-amino acid oxidase-like deaminating enzyme
MKSHARVVVIGGGVVGCSVAYHLTKLGWRDVVLLERDELTSGSTWHAAGGMHTLNSDPNVARLQDYTIRLYREIEAISGQSCGIHLTGGIMLAGTPERLTQVADIGLKGMLVMDDHGEQVEGFQVHLGGSLGLTEGFGKKLRAHKITSAGLDDYITTVVGNFLQEREPDESFAAWAVRADEILLRGEKAL